jgi:hypothetical protein
MSIRHALLALTLALGLPGASMPVTAAAPADPCGLLFVPEDFQLRCTVQRGVADDWRLVIRPDDSIPFGALSELSIEPVEEPVADPQAWLRDQLRLDLSGLEHAVRALAESEDSPFTDEAVVAPLQAWLGVMTSLAELPLQSCEEPSTAGSTLREGSELACEWRIGPLQQHLVIRLVERDGQHYVVRVRAMNERRLRHLVAIANSL